MSDVQRRKRPKLRVPSFGHCLRDARAAREPFLSQEEVAELTGLQSPNVSRLEQGTTVLWPNAYRLIVLCGLDLSFFFPPELILASVPRARKLIKERQPAPDAQPTPDAQPADTTPALAT